MQYVSTSDTQQIKYPVGIILLSKNILICHSNQLKLSSNKENIALANIYFLTNIDTEGQLIVIKTVIIKILSHT